MTPCPASSSPCPHVPSGEATHWECSSPLALCCGLLPQRTFFPEAEHYIMNTRALGYFLIVASFPCRTHRCLLRRVGVFSGLFMSYPSTQSRAWHRAGFQLIFMEWLNQSRQIPNFLRGTLRMGCPRFGIFYALLCYGKYPFVDRYHTWGNLWAIYMYILCIFMIKSILKNLLHAEEWLSEF